MRRTKNMVGIAIALSILTLPIQGWGQDEIVVTGTSEAAGGLNLEAVLEIFKNSDTLEKFEKELNSPDTQVNNLDLDENNKVDYLRVVDQTEGKTHVIIIQAALGEGQFQDVATIEVEKDPDNNYNLQVCGNAEIYGANYYIVPRPTVYVSTWGIVTWIYGPAYRPYHSRFYFGVYPPWWRPYRPVSINIYRTRTVNITRRTNFVVSRNTRVHSTTRVYKTPRSSTLAVKKTKVSSRSGNAVGKSVTKTRVNPATGKTTTVKKGAKKATNPKTGNTGVVKKGGKKVTNPSTGTTRAGKKTVTKTSKGKSVKKKTKTKTKTKKKKH